MKIYDLILKNKNLFITYCLIFIFSLISYINCFDRLTWFLEVIPVYIGIIVIFLFWTKNIAISNLLNIFIIIQMLILIIGGHYSYARVPMFDYIGTLFGWSRNNYDKLGHFVQGITPFLIAKEILIRKYDFKRGFMLNFLCICVSLAFSAFYELLEFTASISLGQGADEFLGMQGDVWDTQKDMLYALIGAITISVFTINYKYKVCK